MPACCIKQCGARKNYKHPTLSFHRLPRNESLRKKWLEAIGVENIKTNIKLTFICSLHFDDKHFNRTMDVIRLRDDAVPFKIVTQHASEHKTRKSKKKQSETMPVLAGPDTSTLGKEAETLVDDSTDDDRNVGDRNVDDRNVDDRNVGDRNVDDRNNHGRNVDDRNNHGRNVGDRNVDDRNNDVRIHGFCRCCLARGQHRQLSQEHSETLMNLHIFLLQDPRLANIVCSSCVASMAMIEEFKRKVVSSETRLVQGLVNSLQQPPRAQEIGTMTPRDPLMMNDEEMEIKKEIREIEESGDTLTLIRIPDGQTTGDQILPVQTNAKEILPNQISTVQTLPVQTNRNQLLVRTSRKVQTMIGPSTNDQTLIGQSKNDQDLNNRIQTNAKEILPNQISTVQTLPVQTNRNQLFVRTSRKVQTMIGPSTNDQTLIGQSKNDQDLNNRIQTKAKQILPNQIITVQTLSVKPSKNQLPVRGRRKVQTLIDPSTNDQTLIGQSKNDQDLNNMDIEEMLVPNVITDKIPPAKTKIHEMNVNKTTGNRTSIKKVLVDVPPEKISKGAIPVVCQRELKNIAMSSQNMVNIKSPSSSRVKLCQTPFCVNSFDTRARPAQNINKQSPVKKYLILRKV